MPGTVTLHNPDLIPAEITLIRRYLTESHLFSGQEWQDLRRIIDKLANCEVQFGTKRYRFVQFYRTFVNGTYAYPFLSELAILQDWGQKEAPQAITVSSLPDARARFPQVVRMRLEHLTWFVVEYETWKQFLFGLQQEGKS